MFSKRFTDMYWLGIMKKFIILRKYKAQKMMCYGYEIFYV